MPVGSVLGSLYQAILSASMVMILEYKHYDLHIDQLFTVGINMWLSAVRIVCSGRSLLLLCMTANYNLCERFCNKLGYRNKPVRTTSISPCCRTVLLEEAHMQLYRTTGRFLVFSFISNSHAWAVMGDAHGGQHAITPYNWSDFNVFISNSHAWSWAVMGDCFRLSCWKLAVTW